MTSRAVAVRMALSAAAQPKRLKEERTVKKRADLSAAVAAIEESNPGMEREELSALGIVIVNFNTVDLLRNCLNSLETCTLLRRTVVVDNASSDGSAAMVPFR